MTTKRDAAWQTREAQGEATPPAPQFCCSGAIHADTAHRTQPHRPALCPPLPCSLAPRGAGPTPRGHPTFPHPPCENSPFRCPMNRWPSASTVPETTWVTTGASHPGGDISANARTTRPPAEKVVPGGTPRSPSNSSPTWGAAEAGTRGPETQICAPLPGPTPASQHGRLRKRAPWVLGGAQGAGRGRGCGAGLRRAGRGRGAGESTGWSTNGCSHHPLGHRHWRQLHEAPFRLGRQQSRARNVIVRCGDGHGAASPES